ncbi:hypothetical protein TRAPUB_13795 [Trametes pubescens]|uniref:Uncharacterized protein n=1 Tax=Trametes pubescens TaxID=154538 RepID=A0A1M2VQ55_TRAPU|nr:hypothetical protein TRAPUB_13795 [Trametes pubescens]
MTSEFINTPEKLSHALQYWKNYTFKDTYYKLQDVADSIDTPRRLVEARACNGGRWTLCHTGFKAGSQEVILHTAAVWMWNSDLDTGNFVPEGQTAPDKVPESRMQKEPSNVCQFSYAVDTSQDKSLYDAQKVFERFIVAQKDFNRANRKRRQWQLGLGNYDNTYIFSAPMFARRAAYPRSAQHSVEYQVHPWLAAATEDPDGAFFPHPERPRILEAAHGEFHNISGCVPPMLQRGDLVWISFYVEFIIGGHSWNPNFVPVEIVRVGTVASHLVGASDEPPTPPKRQTLQAGQTFSLSMDFPMFSDADEPSSPPVASGSHTANVVPDSESDSATLMGSSPGPQARPHSSALIIQAHPQERNLASPFMSAVSGGGSSVRRLSTSNPVQGMLVGPSSALDVSTAGSASVQTVSAPSDTRHVPLGTVAGPSASGGSTRVIQAPAVPESTARLLIPTPSVASIPRGTIVSDGDPVVSTPITHPVVDTTITFAPRRRQPARAVASQDTPKSNETRFTAEDANRITSFHVRSAWSRNASPVDEWQAESPSAGRSKKFKLTGPLAEAADIGPSHIIDDPSEDGVGTSAEELALRVPVRDAATPASKKTQPVASSPLKRKRAAAAKPKSRKVAASSTGGVQDTPPYLVCYKVVRRLSKNDTDTEVRLCAEQSIGVGLCDGLSKGEEQKIMGVYLQDHWPDDTADWVSTLLKKGGRTGKVEVLTVWMRCRGAPMLIGCSRYSAIPDDLSANLIPTLKMYIIPADILLSGVLAPVTTFLEGVGSDTAMDMYLITHSPLLASALFDSVLAFLAARGKARQGEYVDHAVRRRNPDSRGTKA